jgi:hypothetical protein
MPWRQPNILANYDPQPNNNQQQPNNNKKTAKQQKVRQTALNNHQT